MRSGDGRFLAASAQVVGPLFVFCAVVFLLSWPSGSGVGFIAGLMAAMGVLVHTLIFGAAAARVSSFARLQRAGLTLGALAALTGLATTQAPLASLLREVGLFVTTACIGILIVAAFAGRAVRFNEERR
jgi:hypothetical protein